MSSEEPLVFVVHIGGSLVINKDGSVSYAGGEAHLTEVDSKTNFDEFKAEISEMRGGDISGLTFKYALPTNNQTLITISNDKDLKRMVKMNKNASSPEIYVVTKGSIPLNPHQTNDIVVFTPNPANEMTNPPDRRVAAATNRVNESSSTFDREPTEAIFEMSTPEHSYGGRPNKLSVFWENSITGVGQLFKDPQEFREALRKYAVAKNFSYRLVKNNRTCLTAKCKGEGCLWRIHASRVSTTKIIKIKNFKDVHTCDRDFGAGSAHVTRFWIADMIKRKLNETPDYKVSDVVKDIKKEYGLKLNYKQAWRGMETAREQLQGRDVDFYKQLPRYCEKLVETNPGSIATLSTTTEDRFQRLFITFHACVYGFEHGCRPLVFLDSTSLRSKYGGILLIAATVDGNDQLFPIAFAVVEEEDYENWHWFLVQLKSALSSSRSLSFVSDMHKGLKKAVPEVFTDSKHAFCLRYMTRNLKKEMLTTSPKDIKDLLTDLIFSAAKACQKDEFITCIESIRAVSTEAAEWVMGVEPEQWANLFFKGSRYNQMSSNLVEFINQWISKTCDLPVLKLMETIRCEMAELIRVRLEDLQMWNTRLTPKAEEKMQKEIDRSLLVSVAVSSNSVFEVLDDHTYIVDLESLECTCLNWRLMGLPCRHAIASFNYTGKNAYDYCERYYTSEYYRLTYSQSINSVLDLDSVGSISNGETVVNSYPNVELPKTRRQPGRPKRRQMESLDVDRRMFLCSRCKEPGHNKITCKAPRLTS